MKSIEEIKTQIEIETNVNQHILDLPLVSLAEGTNDVVCLMQLVSKTKLEALYWVLGETRPQYRCDKP